MQLEVEAKLKVFQCTVPLTLLMALLLGHALTALTALWPPSSSTGHSYKEQGSPSYNYAFMACHEHVVIQRTPLFLHASFLRLPFVHTAESGQSLSGNFFDKLPNELQSPSL